MRNGGCVVAMMLFWGLLPLGAGPVGVMDETASPSVFAAAGPSFGDFDSDGDVDLFDHFTFALCLDTSGPDVSASPACLVFDSDADAEIDLSEAAAFQNAFTGLILPVCGNGEIESGEQCDDGNVKVADGCSATCTIEIENDYCMNPNAVTEGSLPFSTLGATTDGPNEPADCTFFNNSEIRSDIWYCYSATCTGPATISLCGSVYDTKMAVYDGCNCPHPAQLIDRPVACSDDDCGVGVGNIQSRTTINVTSGQSYMVRVGGFFGSEEQGAGLLTIGCGEDTCEGGTGSCTEPHDPNQPGCNDAACCHRVCEVDTFCCDVTWDAFCADQAGGFCNPNGFPACNPQAGRCDRNHNGPGCEVPDCCNAICLTDPICCIDRWDNACVAQAEVICTFCGPGRGSCLAARTAPGCDDVSCCAKVCGLDEFCCVTEWDATCVQQAQDLCAD